MDLSYKSTMSGLSILLLLTALSQPIYTALYLGAPDVDRSFLWGLEGLLFVLLSAFAGSALVMAKRYSLGFSAIAFSAVLNVVQVGVGHTQFGPVREAVAANPEQTVIPLSIIAFSFFGYNAAKILLGLAAIDFGVAKQKAGGKILGGLTVLFGAVALVSNTILMIFGRDGFLPGPVAGGTGVVATLLLAICLFGLKEED
ncbi:MAG: thiamine biosynthesis protein ThiC [Pseudomonadota bacterium]